MLSPSRGRLSRACCACVFACVVLTACRGGDGQRSEAEPSGARTGSDQSDEARQVAQCQTRQKHAAGHLHGHIYSIPDMVTSALSGSSRAASAQLRGEQVSLRAAVVIGHLPMRSDGAIVRVRPGLYVTPTPAGRHPTCAVPVRRGEP